MTRSAYRLTAAAVATAAFGICYGASHRVPDRRLVDARPVLLRLRGAAHRSLHLLDQVARIACRRRRRRTTRSVFRSRSRGVAMLVIGRLGARHRAGADLAGRDAHRLAPAPFRAPFVRSHWFAIAYLLLMIPIWSVPISHLQDPSRLLSAKIAVNMLDVIGVPVLRQGTNIILPSHTLAVLLECSGVNQLICADGDGVAGRLPVARHQCSRRVALVLLAVVISYLGNGFRIALVGWLAVNGWGTAISMVPARSISSRVSAYLPSDISPSVDASRCSRHRSRQPAGDPTMALRHCRQPCSSRCDATARLAGCRPPPRHAGRRARLHCRQGSSTCT